MATGFIYLIVLIALSPYKPLFPQNTTMCMVRRIESQHRDWKGLPIHRCLLDRISSAVTDQNTTNSCSYFGRRFRESDKTSTKFLLGPNVCTQWTPVRKRLRGVQESVLKPQSFIHLELCYPQSPITLLTREGSTLFLLENLC